MKIIFAGTPEIAAGVLEALIDAKQQIIACLSQPDRPQGRGLKLTPSAVKLCAMQHQIPILQPSSLRNDEAVKKIADLQPDLMIVMAYGLILPAEILSIPKYGCINIHASILPRWRGAAPIQHAILAGDHGSGITIMQMDAGMDTGDILAIYPCKILNTDTSTDLHDRLADLAKTACIDALRNLSAGNLKPIKQDEKLATYANKINKLDARINWQSSAVEIDRCIRAYNPWPVAFSTLKDQTVRIWQASISNSRGQGTPGKILAHHKHGIDVATLDGILCLETLQFPGKKVLPATELCHAHQELNVGEIFT